MFDKVIFLQILSFFTSVIQIMQKGSKNIEEQNVNIRHGLQYLPRDKQPSMYDILSWDHDPLKSNEWLVKMRTDYRQPKFTEPQIYEKPQKISTSPQYPKVSEKSPEKQVKQHPIKHELYYYGDQKAKDKVKLPRGVNKDQKKKIVKKEKGRLNQFDEVDKRQISIRKHNIDEFKYYTRDLPDSAFTTYFGKPAFANYGHSSDHKSIVRHKSHSVMPHAGNNHPEHVQCHAGALAKANVINLEPRIPKIPAPNPQPQKCDVKLSEYYNVEIVKPDLINEVKFSNQDKRLKHKEKTPLHTDLNYLPKRNYPVPLHVGNKNPKKKQIRAKTQEKDDGLAFMGRREKFMKELTQKKKNQGRLAYKVTECYPLDWDNQTAANSTARQEQWKQVRPAGVSSQKYLTARCPFITH